MELTGLLVPITGELMEKISQRFANIGSAD